MHSQWFDRNIGAPNIISDLYLYDDAELDISRVTINFNIPLNCNASLFMNKNIAELPFVSSLLGENAVKEIKENGEAKCETQVLENENFNSDEIERERSVCDIIESATKKHKEDKSNGNDDELTKKHKEDTCEEKDDELLMLPTMQQPKSLRTKSVQRRKAKAKGGVNELMSKYK